MRNKGRKVERGKGSIVKEMEKEQREKGGIEKDRERK